MPACSPLHARAAIVAGVTLIARHGADAGVRVIVPDLTAACPRRGAAALMSRDDDVRQILNLAEELAHRDPVYGVGMVLLAAAALCANKETFLATTARVASNVWEKPS